MKAEHSISFCPEMIQAILDGRKTQTRRVIKLPQGNWWNECPKLADKYIPEIFKCPYGKVGDLLWVREGYYRDDYKTPSGSRYIPSIFMPKRKTRLWLEITNIRVERLQDISVEDCIAEGIPESISGMNIVYAYRDLWNYLNAKRGYGWDENPFVWVIEFKKVRRQ